MHCVSDEDSDEDLVDFQTEEAIAEAIGEDERPFVDDLVDFGISYADRARKDHALFVGAFREGKFDLGRPSAEAATRRLAARKQRAGDTPQAHPLSAWHPGYWPKALQMAPLQAGLPPKPVAGETENTATFTWPLRTAMPAGNGNPPVAAVTVRGDLDDATREAGRDLGERARSAEQLADVAGCRHWPRATPVTVVKPPHERSGLPRRSNCQTFALPGCSECSSPT